MNLTDERSLCFYTLTRTRWYMPLPKARFTTTPDPSAPKLLCPHCDLPLVYRLTVFGGLKPPERWDYLECPKCGSFEYRQRTRTFRRMKIPVAS
jgi:hypothetical protein